MSRLQTIKRESTLFWNVNPNVITSNGTYTLYVLGGNAALIGSGLEGIQYVADPLTLSAVYDPDSDTTYPAGLGYGYLLVNGISQGKVLIRHNYFGAQYTMLEGFLLRVSGTTTLTYSGTDMTAYLFDFL